MGKRQWNQKLPGRKNCWQCFALYGYIFRREGTRWQQEKEIKLNCLRNANKTYTFWDEWILETRTRDSSSLWGQHWLLDRARPSIGSASAHRRRWPYTGVAHAWSWTLTSRHSSSPHSRAKAALPAHTRPRMQLSHIGFSGYGWKYCAASYWAPKSTTESSDTLLDPHYSEPRWRVTTGKPWDNKDSAI